MPHAAVVILSWNGRKFLEEFLPKVLATTQDAEIIVADNASNDDTIAWMKNNFPAIRLIAMEKNRGFAGGYNAALKNLDHDYFILLNQDVAPSFGWVNTLIDVLEKNKTVAAVQPKILSLKNKTQFEYAGAAGGMMDKFGFPFCRGRIFTNCENDNGQFETEEKIHWASGACMAVRADVFKALGGFDERLFAHMEEIDLCWRMMNAGYEIRYTPFSSIYHLGGGSLPQGNPRKVFLNFRNNLLILHKNLPDGKVWNILCRRGFFDKVAAWKFFFGGKFSSGAAVYRAWFRFLFTKGKNAVRKSARMNLKHEAWNDFYPHSIVWKFFFAGKKRWSDLKK